MPLGRVGNEKGYPGMLKGGMGGMDGGALIAGYLSLRS
jgi:hypothetical protein